MEMCTSARIVLVNNLVAHYACILPVDHPVGSLFCTIRRQYTIARCTKVRSILNHLQSSLVGESRSTPGFSWVVRIVSAQVEDEGMRLWDFK